MGQNSRASAIDTAPVGTTVADFLTHAQGFLSEFLRLLPNIENCYDSTHNLILL